MSERIKHPSGRPVRRDIKKSRTMMINPPLEGPLTPRLQIPQRSVEMGFHTAFREIEINGDEE